MSFSYIYLIFFYLYKANILKMSGRNMVLSIWRSLSTSDLENVSENHFSEITHLSMQFYGVKILLKLQFGDFIVVVLFLIINSRQDIPMITDCIECTERSIGKHYTGYYIWYTILPLGRYLLNRQYSFLLNFDTIYDVNSCSFHLNKNGHSMFLVIMSNSYVK